MLTDLKIGDKLRMIEPYIGEGGNNEIVYVAGLTVDGRLRYIEFTKSEGRGNDTNVQHTFGNNTFWTVYGYDSCFEKVEEVKKAKNKPSYKRQAVRDDGILFETDAIGGRTIKEITDSIQERKDSIARDESLLRAHKSLFSKKK